MATATAEKKAKKTPRAARVYTKRTALTPRTVSSYQYDPTPAQITVGYLRQLVAGIPRRVADNYIVEFNTNETRVFHESE